MFSANDNVYVMMQNKNEQKVCRLKLDSNAKNMFLKVFNSGLKKNRNEAIVSCVLNTASQSQIGLINFDAMRALEDDELFIINKFSVPIDFKALLNKPDTIPSFVPHKMSEFDKDGYKIKAIFICKLINNKIITSFQRFTSAQVVSRKAGKIFYIIDAKTFTEHKAFTISIKDESDCIIVGSKLIFKNYHNTNQIFNLTKYYRVATDTEVTSFKGNKLFEIEDLKSFDKNCLGMLNRKIIAKIIDSNVLNKYTLLEIRDKAKSECGLDLATNNDKIILPSDRKKFKEVLLFLSDRVFKGVFSGDTYAAKDARKI